MIYALDEDDRDELVQRSIELAGEVDGVDLVMWLDGESEREAVVRSRRGELRFAPGGELEDARGGRWSVEGELAALRAEVQDGRFLCTEYPDALARIWSALDVPDRGGRAAVRRAGLRVRRLGWG